MPVSVDNWHILNTKLYRPQAAQDVVRRPRIWKRLESYRDRAMTLICAPAGFGKTTLLVDWLAQVDAPSAWFSLDAGDSDLGTFLAYFTAAVRGVFPNACQNTMRLIRGPQLPPLEPLVAALIRDLEVMAAEPALANGQRFIFVLDDYHLLSGQSIHELVNALERHPPRSLHLILSTRHDPPLALHAFRARAALTEIRAAELRFTCDEISEFMERAVATSIDPDLLCLLMERTEGWATGLRLTALALGAGGDVSPDAHLTADNQYVMDYLASEVLTRVPLGTQEFVFKTSILKRLTGSLCDAIAPPRDPLWDGAAYLEWLTGQNVFTFALDSQGTWYRYHHLFQTLLQHWLQRKYTAEDITELHRRASAWYADNGYVEDAVNHAMAAGDEIMAAQLIEANRHQAMNHDQWGQIARWLALLPRRLIDERPDLLLMEAWLLQQQWKFNDIGPLLQQIEDLVAGSTGSEMDALRAELDALRSLVSHYSFASAETRAFAERALANVPRDCSFVRSFAWFYLAAARQMTGDSQGAADTLREGLREDRLHNNAFTTRLYLGFCFLHWLDAQLPALARMSEQIRQLGRERNLPEAVAWGRYFSGCARYMENDLTGAEGEFLAVLRDRYAAHGLAATHSALGLASVYLARGDHEQARAVTDEAMTYGLAMGNGRVILDVEAYRALVALRTGAIAEARAWALTRGANLPLVPLTTFLAALESQAIILAVAQPDSPLLQATLTRLRDYAVTAHNVRVQIEVLALEALMLDASGDLASALTKLRAAVELAEPSRFIRIFVDLGRRMAALLSKLPTDGRQADYVRGILAAFVQEPAPRVAVVPAELIEPLSDRELEVLALLSNRLSNKEIASKLIISPMTVKRHAVNIYQKLAVGSRREAVLKAGQLGLLISEE